MTAYHAWKHVPVWGKWEGSFQSRQQQTCRDGSRKNIYFWRNPIPSCSQAVKTSVCIRIWSLSDSRRSFWNVPALRFQEGFRHRQVKYGMDLSAPCGQTHPGTGLYRAGRRDKTDYCLEGGFAA